MKMAAKTGGVARDPRLTLRGSLFAEAVVVVVKELLAAPLLRAAGGGRAAIFDGRSLSFVAPRRLALLAAAIFFEVAAALVVAWAWGRRGRWGALEAPSRGRSTIKARLRAGRAAIEAAWLRPRRPTIEALLGARRAAAFVEAARRATIGTWSRAAHRRAWATIVAWRRAARAIDRFIAADSAAVDDAAVHLLERDLAVLTGGEADEAEAAAARGLFVLDDDRLGDRPKLLERRPQ